MYQEYKQYTIIPLNKLYNELRTEWNT